MLKPTDHYAQLYVRYGADQEDGLWAVRTNLLDPYPVPSSIDAVLIPRSVARLEFFDSDYDAMDCWNTYLAALTSCKGPAVSGAQIKAVYRATAALELIRAAYPEFCHENHTHCVRLYVIYTVRGKVKTTEVFIPRPAAVFSPAGPVTTKASWYDTAKQLARLEIWPLYDNTVFEDIQIHGVVPIGRWSVEWFKENDDGTYTLTGDLQ